MDVPPEQPTPKSTRTNAEARLANSYYGILGINPDASVITIRQAYRELSKRYHPDTTKLSPLEAKIKFQQLNEAYGTLSNPEKRALYDLNIGYFRYNVVQPLPQLHKNLPNKKPEVGYLEPIDRPLSPGEIFVLFILGVSFIACFLLVIAVAWFRGDPL